MSNGYFQFKRFIVRQDRCAMKVCTDSCILGAYSAFKISERKISVPGILDIGGGTGLLSLMLAQKTNARIDSVELDRTAAIQMLENFSFSPWAEKLNVIHGDIRQLRLEKYNFIISNPPFFEKGLKGGHAETTLAKHDSGLLLAELAEVIHKSLGCGGAYCVMVPHFRHDYMKEQLEKNKLSVSEVIHIRQTPSHPQPFRSIIFGTPSESDNKIATKELIIRSDNNDYTEEFRFLLRDYYLFLGM